MSRELPPVAVLGATGHTGRFVEVTAPLVVEAAQRLLSGQARKASGARAPGELFDARGFLSALAPEHLTVTFQDR